jgi:3-hydroxybutyryl-CoA dehydrogenase
VNSAAGAGTPPAPAPIRTVAVIGAGTAGRSFALACCAAGFRVILEDVMPANLRRAQEEYAPRASSANGGTLELAATIEAAVREADVVVDFVPDELESKLEIFCLVDRMAPPKTTILTPSDALSITDLASCTYRGDRCFAVRGAFPEVARGGAVRVLHAPEFNAASLNSVAEFVEALGGVVEILVDQDAPMLVKNQR